MNTVHVRALERAADMRGGIPELAAELGIPPTTLILMMDGSIGVPSEIFVKVVDIIIKADLSSVGAPTVLVVEDDPATAYSFSRLIRQLGYRVETAVDGRSALEHIRTMRPLVAFIDLRLPDLDGREIAEIVRVERLPTRVVAVTAYGAGTKERERSLAAGFEEHFAKPVDPKSVEAVLPRRARNA